MGTPVWVLLTLLVIFPPPVISSATLPVKTHGVAYLPPGIDRSGLRTNSVARDELSQFQVRIQNDDTQPRTCLLFAAETGNTGWDAKYLFGGQDISAQVRRAGHGAMRKEGTAVRVAGYRRTR